MSSLFQPHLRGCAAEPELLPAGTFPPKWMNPRVGRPYDPRDTSGTSNHHISSDNCPPLGIFTSKTLCTTAETGSPRNPTIDEQSSKIANRVRVGPADCYSTADTGSSSSDGGWPSLSITRTHPTKWVPHSSRSVRRVGAMPHAAPILTLPKSSTTKSIIPALANNATTAHPPL